MTKKKFQVRDIVEIKWIDACDYNAWQSYCDFVKEVNKPASFIIDTVGYFLAEDKDSYHICRTIEIAPLDKADIEGQFSIPKKWVKNIRRIK